MTLSPMMKKTMVITAAALRSLSPGIAPSRLAGWAPLTRIPRRAMRARRFAISHSTRNLCRRSRGRRTDESVLHEEFRFLAGPSNQLEGSLIEGVSGLRLPRDSLLHRLEGYRGRLPGEHVDLIHRGHDVRLVEALFLCDLLQLEFPFLGGIVRHDLDILSMTTDDSFRVDEDDVLRARARGDQELRGPDIRRPGTDERDCDVRHLLADDLQGVDEAGDVDRRGPLLVVVPHRDLTLLPQTLEDVETFRLRDVFEVHATERGGDELDGLDDLLRVLRREGDRECVDAAEVFEQQGLALHHRQSGFGPDVPEAEDASAVRDDRDLIPLVRQGPNLARVRRDVEAGLRDPGRVPDREIVEAPHRHAGHDLDLALIVRVVLRRLFLREVRALQVLLDFLERRRLHLLATRALLRGYHRSTRKELGEETRWLP